MATADPSTPDLEDPHLLPFLPLLYLAWADGNLEPEEIRRIGAQASAAPGLAPGLCASLRRWLDPERPPSPALLQGLLAPIRRGAALLSAPQRLSLSALGQELARGLGNEVAPAVREALRSLEAAIGVPGEPAPRWLLGRPLPVAGPEAPTEDAGASFDPRALLRLLDGPHHGLRERVRDLIAEPFFQPPPELARAAYRDWVLERCRELAARGYGGLSYPASRGGAGDYGAFLATFETLAYGDLSLLVKFGVQFGLFGGSILQLGTERHHERYLREVGTLEIPGCFAMTETGHGSNVHDLETVATYDPASREFVLRTPSDSGRKDYIGNAGRDGRLATVFAQLQVGEDVHGVHAFLVPIRDAEGRPVPGVRLEDCGAKMGLNGVDNGRIRLDEVRIPRDNLLDRFGQVSPEGVYTSSIVSPSRRFFTMLGTLVGGRLSVGLAALSATKSALTIAVRYTDRRRQFGPEGGAEIRVLDYSSLQRRLLPRLAATYALDLAYAESVRQFLDFTVEDRRDLEGQIAGLKAFASWHATDTIQACREACGGRGYMADSRFATLKADTDVFTTFEGDNAVLLQLLGKSLLTGYRKQFGDMRLFGLVRYLAAQAEETLTELNPIVTRRTDEVHLRGREFFLGALDWRARHLVSSVARRIKRKVESGGAGGGRMDPFQAVNEFQDQVIEAARAQVESLVAQRFADAIDSAGAAEGGLRPVLEQLLQLHALARIEADRGWFLERGYLEGGKAKAVRMTVANLCRELRPQAVPLVEAFGVPEAWAPVL